MDVQLVRHLRFLPVIILFLYALGVNAQSGFSIHPVTLDTNGLTFRDITFNHEEIYSPLLNRINDSDSLFALKYNDLIFFGAVINPSDITASATGSSVILYPVIVNNETRFVTDDESQPFFVLSFLRKMIDSSSMFNTEPNHGIFKSTLINSDRSSVCFRFFDTDLKKFNTLIFSYGQNAFEMDIFH